HPVGSADGRRGPEGFPRRPGLVHSGSEGGVELAANCEKENQLAKEFFRLPVYPLPWLVKHPNRDNVANSLPSLERTVTIKSHILPPSASEGSPMPSAGSVTHWLGLLKAGDHAAAQPLWERYFQHLVSLARARLWGAPKRMADEEDVALSAFDSFCRGAAEGRFPQLLDRNDLCQSLVLITARKAIHLLQHERRQKRGGGKVQGELAWTSASEDARRA